MFPVPSSGQNLFRTDHAYDLKKWSNVMLQFVILAFISYFSWEWVPLWLCEAAWNVDQNKHGRHAREDTHATLWTLSQEALGTGDSSVIRKFFRVMKHFRRFILNFLHITCGVHVMISHTVYIKYLWLNSESAASWSSSISEVMCCVLDD